MSNRPPDHRYPPILSLIALIVFCWAGLWLMITILDTIYHSQP